MSQNEKDTVVQIISSTFALNPSVNSVIGTGGNRSKKLKRLSRYAYFKGLNRQGIHLSSNRKGVAICFRSDQNKSSLSELYAEFRFALTLKPKLIFRALKRERYIVTHRIEQPHLYFWFFGVEKGGGQAAFELADKIIENSKREGLPILLETSVARNKVIYERYGFKVYHEWIDETGTPLWFMSKPAKNEQIQNYG